MTQAEPAAANHRVAPRMATIAFLSHNLTIGCIFGSYGVLIEAIEAKMRMSRVLSSLGIPLVMLAVALSAPVIGVLVAKIRIRLLLILGALMMGVGFTALAVGRSVYVFLMVYALLLGPALALNSTMLPSTLVTRWYNVKRGRTLGIVNMPILAAGMAPAAALMLTHYGLSATYFMLAGLSALLLPIALFVIDYPPNTTDPTGEYVAAEVAADPGMSVGELFSTARFWTLLVAFAAITSGATVLAAHVVPMAMGWGIDAARAAGLVSFSSIGGIIGSAVWGAVADRLGGARTLSILCVSGAILWTLILPQPPYAAMALLVGVMGFTSAAVVPVASVALSQLFGRGSFGRAYGVLNLVNLPFLVLGVPVAAHVYVRTGSYTTAIIGVAAFDLLGMLCALMSDAPASRSYDQVQ
jgi:cyanate permease